MICDPPLPPPACGSPRTHFHRFLFPLTLSPLTLGPLTLSPHLLIHLPPLPFPSFCLPACLPACPRPAYLPARVQPTSLPARIHPTYLPARIHPTCRFDMYSVGMTLLQMTFPYLRNDDNLIAFNR